MAKLDNKKVIEQIIKSNGNLSAVARYFGVARNTIYAYIKKYPTAQEALDEARESMIDNVESKLYGNALNGDNAAIIFFLKTQGNRRGYTERLRVDYSKLSDEELQRIADGDE